MFGTRWVDNKCLLSHGVLETLNTGQVFGILDRLGGGKALFELSGGCEDPGELAGHGFLNMRMLS